MQSSDRGGDCRFGSADRTQLQPWKVSLSQEGYSQHMRADRAGTITQWDEMTVNVYTASPASQCA
ncbi:hypothetical protein BA011_29895 (plasmid) [Rhizobium leguminosarum]|uniref:Uncharacterized protein n=1 Tax=Rhizobium leguminosarum TaxID=384 RepID=A0A1B1CJF6_RHILE|nr:hypothetical protein BA011_29895 [Rhizobium leguminosarum]